MTNREYDSTGQEEVQQADLDTDEVNSENDNVRDDNDNENTSQDTLWMTGDPFGG